MCLSCRARPFLIATEELLPGVGSVTTLLRGHLSDLSPFFKAAGPPAEDPRLLRAGVSSSPPPRFPAVIPFRMSSRTPLSGVLQFGKHDRSGAVARSSVRARSLCTVHRCATAGRGGGVGLLILSERPGTGRTLTR